MASLRGPPTMGAWRPPTLPSPTAQRFRVTGGARLVGEVRVTGAKNSVLKLMAAALLARASRRCARCPTSSTLRSCPSCFAGSAATFSVIGRGATRHHRRPRARSITGPTTTWYARMRASIAVLGPLLARTGEADVALPGGDAIGSTTARLPHCRPAQARRDDRERARLHRRQGQATHGCDDLARLSERRRHREPADGGSAGRRSHRDRQRCARAGDRRSLRHASARWVRRSKGPEPRRSMIDGVDALQPVSHDDGGRPDRRRHLGHGRDDDVGRRHRAQRRSCSSRDRARQARHCRGHGRPHRRRVPRDDGSASHRCRRGHLALPRVPHRPAAHGPGAQCRRVWNGHGHRECVRVALLVRQRAGPTRGRHPHRRSPRRGAWSSAAFRCARHDARHPGRCRSRDRRPRR